MNHRTPLNRFIVIVQERIKIQKKALIHPNFLFIFPFWHVNQKRIQINGGPGEGELKKTFSAELFPYKC